jgi:hypothetical protein
MHFNFRSLLVAVLACTSLQADAVQFDLVTPQNKVTIVYAADDHKLDSIAAHLLARDIQQVSGYLPKVTNSISKATGNVILIGTLQSALIKGLHLNIKTLQGRWESYSLQTISRPTKNINQALIIAGSDVRGAAYGVFNVSERIGVSPWYWWADVAPVQQKKLSISIDQYLSASPSVKYRGIFINDEDWGLQPWAAKTFEPKTGDIGPKTYTKVFELLLRLKANLIWPAMHPSTKAFYSYPSNIKVASDYEIVVGSSHAEPMLRNNVGEWNEKTMGAFNYITNKPKVYDYWESRVKESSVNNAIYSMGMRGVHDSGMEGVKSPKEAVPLLDKIFADQRGLLQKYVNADVAKIPQAFTIYKEVLDVYESGLKVPDDITLVWPDDNYGYIQRLSNAQEQQRSGGSGVYYHASYWGRPHDYLWLSTTNPALMREEMMKAYAMQAKNIWVLNVGDIKPCEYNMQLFLDMAYQAEPFKNSAYLQTHLQQWCAGKWGAKNAGTVAGLIKQYYQLAWEHRPEFMGWSQTEPTTKTNYTAYNHFAYGDEAQRRLDQYQALAGKAKSLYTEGTLTNKDAFYELVYYPIVGSSLMNQKFLYRDKAYLYGKENRLVAQEYAEKSKQAYQDIITETSYYNNQLAGGKWKNIMSMQPRNLPVYQAPELPAIGLKPTASNWSIMPEGSYPDTLQATQQSFALPAFYPWSAHAKFVDVFLQKDANIKWKATASQPWVVISNSEGQLANQNNERQNRIYVNINWKLLAQQPAMHTAQLSISAAGKTYTLDISADNSKLPVLANFKGAVENNGRVSIFAGDYQKQQNQGARHWQTDSTLGYAQNALVAMPVGSDIIADTSLTSTAWVAYEFYIINTAAKPQLQVFTLPTHPLNRAYGMHYAVAVDGGAPQVLNFKTEGRSTEWKNNVLSNNAIRKLTLQELPPGKHQLKLYLIDPGVIVDRFLITLDSDFKPAYSLIPESKL